MESFFYHQRVIASDISEISTFLQHNTLTKHRSQPSCKKFVKPQTRRERTGVINNYKEVASRKKKCPKYSLNALNISVSNAP
ncbi:MAG: hypothetical protein ACTSPD_08150 [Promethearchaeota archaeon]